MWWIYDVLVMNKHTGFHQAEPNVVFLYTACATDPQQQAACGGGDGAQVVHFYYERHQPINLPGNGGLRYDLYEDV